ncbi:MAG: hypothetical protein H6Q04_1086 [Acidobacteria bacterium]|nr:hypothetical protein [Acidobacteriota bacterium]
MGSKQPRELKERVEQADGFYIYDFFVFPQDKSSSNIFAEEFRTQQRLATHVSLLN